MSVEILGWDETDEADYLWNRRYERRLSAHPDCRDPAHPGCDYCSDERCEEKEPCEE